VHKRVGFALFTDFGGRTVAGKDGDIIAEREQFLFNSPKQLWRITSREVPSPHASGKKNIASDQELFGAKEKAKAPGTMAGNLENLKIRPEEFAPGSFLDEKIGCDRFEIETKAEVPEEIRISDHRGGIRVTTYRAIKVSLNFRDIDDMIDVSVGQDQQL
jgi:hypothetical protein